MRRMKAIPIFLSILALTLAILIIGCGGNEGSGESETCTDSDTDNYYAESGCGTAVDCIDGDGNVNPGATEVCNDTVDNDCDNTTDCSDSDCIGDEACIHSGMALIPSGCFDMGDSFTEGDFNERPVHTVCITSDFHMDVHEVTNAEYAACVSADVCSPPIRLSSSTRDSYYGNPDYDNFPVINVSWNKANEYCIWAGKRLPTEAEWEYAARGGLSGKRYPWGDTLSRTDANYFDSSDLWGNDTSQVEYYTANEYGLYDMAGNVFEWVNDWYQWNYYVESPTNDPPGPTWNELNYKIVRGGDWESYPYKLRVAYRGFAFGKEIGDIIGFRCAGD